MHAELETYMYMLSAFSEGLSEVIARAAEEDVPEGLEILLESIRSTQAILELNAFECESLLAR